MRLYIETRIRADIGRVWERSQQPGQHRRWDLRFGDIAYLPCALGEPQRFRYATRVLPGVTVDGTGVSAGERERPDGSRLSALRFSSAHPLSLIAEGSGYWRYIPDGDGLRFLTGYDYRPRWGRFGRAADRFLFRPLMGWATAWSFDRLRLWCERGVSPERSLLNALAELIARVAVVLAATAVTVAAVPARSPVAVALATAVPAAVTVAALLVPPLPATPAARRALRRPPGRVQDAGGAGSTSSTGGAGGGGTEAVPALLGTLEQP